MVISRKIGIIGLGNVGRTIAKNLRKKGFKIYSVYDLDNTKANNLGVKCASEPSEVAFNCDLILTALPRPEHVKKVMLGDKGILNCLTKGSIWIDHSTTDYIQMLDFARQGKKLGIQSLEAPITGGMTLLEKGKMTVYVGGPNKIYKYCKNLFEVNFCSQFYMGSIGSATITKVISNMLAAAHTLLTAESMMLAKKSGVNLDVFFQAIRKSAGNSFVFETEGPLILNQTFDPDFTVGLQCKDLNLGYQLSMANRCPLKLLGLVEQLYNEARFRYGENSPSTIPAKLIEDALEERLYTPGYENFSYTVRNLKDSWAVEHTMDRKI